jgi:hypothetical protein
VAPASPRELSVLGLLAEGYSYTALAAQLGITANMVRKALTVGGGRLFSTPWWRTDSLSRGGVGMSADTARASACSTSSLPNCWYRFVPPCLVFFASRDDFFAARVRRTKENSPARQRWEWVKDTGSPGTGRRGPTAHAVGYVVSPSGLGVSVAALPLCGAHIHALGERRQMR